MDTEKKTIPRIGNVPRYTFIASVPLLFVIYSLLLDSGTALIVYFDSSQRLHRDLYYHPEQPERIAKCVEAIEDKYSTTVDPIKLVDCSPVELRTSTRTGFAQSLPFTQEELDHALETLLHTHEPEMVLKLQEKSRLAKTKRQADGKVALGHMGYLDSDTYVTTETFDVCLRSVAAWIRAIDDSGPSFALTRPPGHHATYKTSNGFCIFNFAAASAIHAARKGKKVAILDWDVHYGQGVADIVSRQEHAAMIRYASIHQSPAFPYEGERRETTQNVRTIPIPSDTTWSCGYESAFEDGLRFVFGDDDPSTWQPDVIVVCAGYDALANDELAGTCLTKKDYYVMTKMLYKKMKTLEAAPSLMMGLEGGYQLRQVGESGNLPDACLFTIDAMVEETMAHR